jgi:hypothetical protein
MDWKSTAIGFGVGVVVAAAMVRYETNVTGSSFVVMTDRWTGRAWRTLAAQPWERIPSAPPPQDGLSQRRSPACEELARAAPEVISLEDWRRCFSGGPSDKR